VNIGTKLLFGFRPATDRQPIGNRSATCWLPVGCRPVARNRSATDRQPTGNQQVVSDNLLVAGRLPTGCPQPTGNRPATDRQPTSYLPTTIRANMHKTFRPPVCPAFHQMPPAAAAAAFPKHTQAACPRCDRKLSSRQTASQQKLEPVADNCWIQQKTSVTSLARKRTELI